MEQDLLLILCLAVVLGACLGSFANATALRLADDKSLLHGSTCIDCSRRLTISENLPIISYIFLLGRCRCRQIQLPARYLIAETAMAVFAVLLVLPHHATMLAKPEQLMALAVMLGAYTIILIQAMLDWQTLTLDTRLSLLLLALGLADRVITTDPAAFIAAIMAAITGFLLVYLIDSGYRRLRGTAGYGRGDALLISAAASFGTIEDALLLFFLANVIGAIWGGVLMLVGDASPRLALPFGVCIAAAFIFMHLVPNGLN